MKDEERLWPNHADARREWRSAMASARMHHGWIFAGKKGLGKAAFARQAARELVAEPGVPQPGDHPDILTLTYGPKDRKAESARDKGKPYDLARSIRVGQIRELQKRLTTRPTLGSRRAIIIDPADDLEKAGANALLKSLEEPPAGTFFLLVAHSSSRLLPTIRSRCRMLRFPTLAEADLAEMLAEEGYAPDPAALRAADGSHGAAVRFMEQDLMPVARLIDGLLSVGDNGFVARADLARAIGPRADRERIGAVLELAQGITSSMACSADDPERRMALIEAHAELVALASAAPTANFDTGLLAMQIGTLLVGAQATSERRHG